MLDVEWNMRVCLLPLCFFFALVECFPNGPPVSACDNGLPVHGTITPQKSSAPFEIIVNKTTIRPGSVVQVTVKGTNGNPFKGLFLQAREVIRDTNEVLIRPVGTYDRIIKNTDIMTCVNSMDTLGHEDPYSKYSTEFNWIAPLRLKNNVVVRATILSDFSTYWTNVDSELMYVEDTDSSAIDNLEKPWLRQIVSALKTQDNKQAAEEAVMSRFQKGFTGVLDASGRPIVHYVLDLLPFEDQYGPVMYSPVRQAAVTVVSRPKSDGVLNITSSQSFNGAAADADGRVVFSGSKLGNSSTERTLSAAELEKKQRYDSLVKELLAGDRQAAEDIQPYLT